MELDASIWTSKYIEQLNIVMTTKRALRISRRAQSEFVGFSARSRIWTVVRFSMQYCASDVLLAKKLDQRWIAIDEVFSLSKNGLAVKTRWESAAVYAAKGSTTSPAYCN